MLQVAILKDCESNGGLCITTHAAESHSVGPKVDEV